MTLDIGKTLVNWNASTSNSAAVGLIFKSAASGSGANSVQSVCRIYDPSALTDNLIEGSVSADNFKNPFTHRSLLGSHSLKQTDQSYEGISR